MEEAQLHQEGSVMDLLIRFVVVALAFVACCFAAGALLALWGLTEDRDAMDAQSSTGVADSAATAECDRPREPRVGRASSTAQRVADLRRDQATAQERMKRPLMFPRRLDGPAR